MVFWTVGCISVGSVIVLFQLAIWWHWTAYKRGHIMDVGHNNGHVQKLLPRRRVEVVSGGYVSTDAPQTSMKVLFIVPRREYQIMMDRWYFNIYEAAQTIPHYDVYGWGKGFFGYNRICKCDDKIGGEMFFACPDSYFESEEGQAPIQGGKDTQAREAFSKLQAQSTECENLKVASFVEHINILFDAESKPFDFICYTWIGVPKRDIHFAGLNPVTPTIMIELEWHARTLKDLETSRPDIMLSSFIDHVEENFLLRHYVRSALQSYSYDILKASWGILETFGMLLDGDYNVTNVLTMFGLNMVYGYMPLGILPQCSDEWEDVLTDDTNLTSPLSLKSQDILFVGKVADHYPTRELFRRMLRINHLEIKSHVHVRKHPGYTEAGNNMEFDAKAQYKDYLYNLEQSKICFIGGISTWSIRKYKEAMAARCLVVGDVPADHHLAQYMINLKLVPPGYYNFDEEKDVTAANEASATRLGNIANWWCDNAECTNSLEQEKLQYTWESRDLYAIGRLYVTVRDAFAKRLAALLLDVLERYEKGEYDALIASARRVALTEYSYQHIITNWLEPAVVAWRGGERGWLRTPAYFQDSYKYRARHYYLLREWLLRREGSGILPYLKDITYGKLLKWASHRLREDTRNVCLRDRAKGNLLNCDDPSHDYFPSMFDFDVEFVKYRKLYSQKYALDTYSHRHSYHMAALYDNKLL